jgi:hypothetical protein
MFETERAAERDQACCLFGDQEARNTGDSLAAALAEGDA